MKKSIKKIILLSSLFSLLSCNKVTTKNFIDESIKLICPSGAPTLAIYEAIMSEKSVTTSTPKEIPVEMQNDKSEYNMAVFESFNAIKLINAKKANYKFLGLLTIGNFYFVGFNKKAGDIPSINDYIVSFNEGSVVDLSLKYVLSDVYNKDNTNIHYLNGVTQVATCLKSGLHENNKIDWALIAEPSLYSVKNANNNDADENNDIYEYMNVNNTIKEKTNNKFPFVPQAGLFVKNSFYEENTKIVEDFLTNSVSKCLKNATTNTKNIHKFFKDNKIEEETIKEKMGFSSSLIDPLQANNLNRFGMAPYDSLINGENPINESYVLDYLKLIS